MKELTGQEPNSILETLQSPDDIKKLSIDELTIGR